jgi:hypothetical protein
MRTPTGSKLIDVSTERGPFCQSDNSRIVLPAGPISLIGLALAERYHLSLVGMQKCERSLIQKVEYRLLQKTGQENKL